MRIILIDNYDSFTYNLVHYFEKWGATVQIVLNDQPEPKWQDYDACVISPGPGLPEESGKLLQWMEAWALTQKPLLGICLGLQAMVVHAKGSLVQMTTPLHGTEGIITSIDSLSLWSKIPTPLTIAHYHSWIAKESSLPSSYRISAKDLKNQIMVIENPKSHWYGIQFHPESIMTLDGYLWIETWCNFVTQK